MSSGIQHEVVIQRKYSDISVIATWRNDVEHGMVTSYDCFGNRLFDNRYDMKEFANRKEFDVWSKKLVTRSKSYKTIEFG